MPEEREYVHGITGDSGIFEITAIESRAERWRQLRGPLTDLLAHGTITGGDIADVGFVVAAGFCLVGALTAVVAAVAEFRSQRA